MKLDHVCILTPDAERLIAWYKDKLGFELIQTWTVDAMPGLTLHYIGRDGFQIEIVGDVPRADENADHALENIKPGYNHFAVTVDDIAATLDDLTKKNVEVATPVMDVPQAGIRAAIITDLDANTIELIEKIG